MTALPPFHTKSSLETLQWQCHNASKIIQTHVRKERWEKSEEPSLITLTILIMYVPRLESNPNGLRYTPG